MKITIIHIDGAVYKDGVSFGSLDLSFIPSNIHALQWVEDKGWIEFAQDENFNKQANEAITTLPSWVEQSLTKWEEANTAFIAAQAAALQEAAQQSNSKEQLA